LAKNPENLINSIRLKLVKLSILYVTRTRMASIAVVQIR